VEGDDSSDNTDAGVSGGVVGSEEGGGCEGETRGRLGGTEKGSERAACCVVCVCEFGVGSVRRNRRTVGVNLPEGGPRLRGARGLYGVQT